MPVLRLTQGCWGEGGERSGQIRRLPFLIQELLLQSWQVLRKGLYYSASTNKNTSKVCFDKKIHSRGSQSKPIIGDFQQYIFLLPLALVCPIFRLFKQYAQNSSRLLHYSTPDSGSIAVPDLGTVLFQTSTQFYSRSRNNSCS